MTTPAGAQLSDEEALRLYHEEAMIEYDCAVREKHALLSKLNVAELRVLLVHYGFADKGRDARSWPRTEMLECLADYMAEAE